MFGERNALSSLCKEGEFSIDEVRMALREGAEDDAREAMDIVRPHEFAV